MRKTIILLALGLLGLSLGIGLWGCAPDHPTAPKVALESGDARVARPVVSIGNSLTAGHVNSGLNIIGQLASFPHVLSKQAGGPPIGVVGTSTVHMQMPLIITGDGTAQQKGIGSTTAPDGTPLTGLYVDGGTLQITADLLPLAEVPDWLQNDTYPLAYDNLGVPGAYAADAASATSSANSQKPNNSFFDFVLRNSALPPFNATQLTQLESHFTKETIVGVDGDTGAPIYGISIPQIITVWLGGNDVLLGASGGNPVVGDNVTSSTEFEATLVSVLDRVASMAAVGKSMVALGNMQTRLPYFDTVPLGTDVGGGTFLNWNTEEENVVFVLLTASSLGLGPDYLPGGTEEIPSTMTLTQDEWDAVKAELDAYNQIISDQATARGWAHADIEAAMSTLPAAPGPGTDGVNGLFCWLDLTGDGIPEQNTYSVFSLDGIHPSEKGYTVIANVFVDALNTTYSTTYPTADVNAVSNITGFEQTLVPGKSSATAVGPLFTELGAAALSGLGR